MNVFLMGTTIITYAGRGGVIAAGAGMLLISLATWAGYLPQTPTDRLITVLTNYFLIGAVIGAVVGVVVVWRDWGE